MGHGAGPWSAAGRRTLARLLVAGAALAGAVPAGGAASPRAAQELVPAGAARHDAGRFTIIAYPEEERLARSLLAEAQARDTFPGLPRLRAPVVIALARDDAMFRALVGSGAPEWGAAIAFPASQRIVMHGRDAGANAGDPRVTLRHELAHLALFEALGPDVPTWFNEGYASYAAGEWGREEVLATSLGLVWRGLPTLDRLDEGFGGGSEVAQRSYALAHRAVAELASLDERRGLDLLFSYWRDHGSFEAALRSAYGMSGADFERHWHRRVKRQYGALALVADLSVLSVLLSGLLGPLWWQRRKRQRRRLERMRQADAAQEARERESALAALLGEGPGPPNDERIKGS
jgi:hypothetical protein